MKAAYPGAFLFEGTPGKCPLIVEIIDHREK